jgi:transcription antitermination factor NusG
VKCVTGALRDPDGELLTLTAADMHSLEAMSQPMPTSDADRHHSFKAGDRVLVVDGPFEGQTLTVTRATPKSITCDIGFLGSRRPVELHPAVVVRA